MITLLFFLWLLLHLKISLHVCTYRLSPPYFGLMMKDCVILLTGDIYLRGKSFDFTPQEGTCGLSLCFKVLNCVWLISRLDPRCWTWVVTPMEMLCNECLFTASCLLTKYCFLCFLNSGKINPAPWLTTQLNRQSHWDICPPDVLKMVSSALTSSVFTVCSQCEPDGLFPPEGGARGSNSMDVGTHFIIILARKWF